MLKSGLYEQVINHLLSQQLTLEGQEHVRTSPIDPAESAKILAKYVGDLVEEKLSHIQGGQDNLYEQIAAVNEIICALYPEDSQQQDSALIDDRAEQLIAILSGKYLPSFSNRSAEPIRPVTSIAQSSLFTGAIHEPELFSELKKEILSCDQINMLVSFIKWSGLRLIIEDLHSFTQRGGQLRVITTSYMGATDIKAIEELNKLPNCKIKVSYDTKRTRLHAKSYTFFRSTGFTTAYVGSSNLSNAAISSGLEWNVKVTAKDLPETIKKINATFDSYWNSSEFEFYSVDEKSRLMNALRAERTHGSTNEQNYFFDIQPYPYQQEILDKLEAERTIRGNFNNLVVAATGTGKTVISAFDYKRFRQVQAKSSCRLLFVAHREEILQQSLNCFRGVLHDYNFGELFVGSYRPSSLEHLFISIQTFNSQDFTNLTPQDYYDFIIVDEFHHAAAPSYQKLLSYYHTKILLGLTATPERMDGQSIFTYFKDRIAAEIRLPEAINRKLLCPFQYFGVTDSVDLQDLRWTRGGYDRGQLSLVYTTGSIATKQRINLIIESLNKYVTDIDEVKGLGFCVSVEHAGFMADVFNKTGIPSVALTGQSPDELRADAKRSLLSGEIRFIFTVDIYNEGVDIPEVNTVLFLRPTESLTIFLQQLGRGLRLVPGKDCLTVLDFIGQANRNYSFESKFAALLDHTRKSVEGEIRGGFSSVPKGCFIQLERKAQEYILENIRNAFGKKAGILSRINSFEADTAQTLSMSNFVSYYRLDPRNLYKRSNFSRLCVEAGALTDFSESLETMMNAAFKRMCSINSRRWLKFLQRVLSTIENISFATLSEEEVKMLQMLQFTIWQKRVEDCGFQDMKAALIYLKSNPVMYRETQDLLAINFNRIDFVDQAVDLGFPCPLDISCSYTRDQILVALDYMTPTNIREGVKYLPEKKCDVFFITLNKADKDYSPTTMYDDYSINETLFHWQSQSTTSANSSTGQRYIHHKEMGSQILLFVREFKDDICGASPYTYLGPAEYVSHEGSGPMSIIWRLLHPIPARFLSMTNKLVVG